jgi:uncharacterized protein
MKRVTFNNRGLEIVGELHLPDDFDEARSWTAIVLATPGSSVKEQIGRNYAGRLAQRGFLALTFDPAHQGESGGEPRDLEDPETRVEDIRCALDHLMTLPFVAEDRVGLLGVCAGGGYAVRAALTEHRFRAVGTVVGGDIGHAMRGMQDRKGLMDLLQAVGAQRTAEARGGEARREPWIPDSLEAAKAQGVTDQEVLAAVRFYREPPHRHSRSTNRLLFTSFGHILGFDPFSLVPELLVQPLQVIVGGERGATGQYEAGERLFQLAPNPDKAFIVVEGAGHYDMYHAPDYVDQAIEHLAPFFADRLAG